MKKVLIACESSGVVREAFRRRGFDAWSCDLLPADDRSPYHFQEDVRNLLARTMGQWHLMIAHPPCTHVAGSGARWLTDHWVTKKSAPGGRYWHDGSAKRAAQAEAVEFIRDLWESQVPRIAIENPIGMLPRLWRDWDQMIHPWQFGHGETKGTCLWLKNLPKLVPTRIVEGREGRVWKMPPSKDRWKERSRTYDGIGEAFAEQWGKALQEAA